MKRLLTLMMILALLVTPFAATAQDPGSKEDNACNPGGSMDGKCDTQWAWVCGWYIARFNNGTFTRAQVISMCETLLPPLSAQTVLGDFPSGGCLFLFGFYVDFKGGFSLPIGADLYSDSSCTVSCGCLFADIVYAPPGYDPNALCQAAFGMEALPFPFDSIYACF